MYNAILVLCYIYTHDLNVNYNLDSIIQEVLVNDKINGVLE